VADSCNDLREREELTNLLQGTYGPLGWGSISNAEHHWNHCRSCQGEFPNAASTLLSLQLTVEEQIRNQFREYRHKFISRKHAALSETPFEDTRLFPQAKGFAKIVAALFRYGWEIQDALGFIHGYGGLAEFSLFADPNEGEVGDAWRNSGPFLASLDSDTKDFAFTALLAYDLLMDSFSTREDDSTPIIFHSVLKR
jgi:hypothetical protein